MPLHLRIKTAAPAPISFAPSQEWRGNDGSWSTFVVRIGSPEQVFEVLISTTSQEIWVVGVGRCSQMATADCGMLQGVWPFRNAPSSGFQTNASDTWVPEGLYALSLDAMLNYTGNGEYGSESVGIQVPQSGGVSLTNQVVARMGKTDFFLGMFGLGPRPTNYTNSDNPQPSFLWSLKNQSLIPSLSWGYTAGAPYRIKGVFGSLTLGGYDSSRFTANNQSFLFGSDETRPLVVALQRIHLSDSFSGVAEPLQTGILAALDSTVPELWLPETACDAFEKFFKLSYDKQTDRYLVSDEVHTNLTAMNPSITLTLGDTIDSSSSVRITLPYAAFDLNLSPPIKPNATKYFPLRRASNETQYTLGRTFFQEAYVIADYERSTFSVSQSKFEENNTQQIVPIYSTSLPSHKHAINNGALAGIIIGVVTAVVLAAGSVIIIFRRMKKRRLASPEAKSSLETHDAIKEPFEVNDNEVSELSPTDVKPELVGIELKHELATMERSVELPI